MNICTWSTDDFRSDVHCTQAADGSFTTHVASHRYETECPRSVPVFEILEAIGESRVQAMDRFCATAMAQQEWARSTPLVRIGGDLDGELFHDSTLEGMLVRLTTISRAGYRVPTSVFDRVRWMIGYAPELRKVAA
jgi:hypothetical protein